MAWWNRSFEGLGCSPGLKLHSHLLTALQQWMPEDKDPVVAVKICWSDATEYFPFGISGSGDEAGVAVNLSENCFIFIREQIFSCSNNDGVCKPSELKNHFSKCVTSINSTTSAVAQPHRYDVQSVAVNTEDTANNERILEAYKQRLLEVYSKSSHLFLTSHKLNEFSIGFLKELGNKKKEAARACKPHFEQLKQFHNGVQSSLKFIEAEMDAHVGETLSLYEKISTNRFKHLEDCRNGQEVQHINVTAIVEKISLKVLTALGSSQSPLEGEMENLTAKLKHVITQKLLKDLDTLQHQIALIVQTYKIFKSELVDRIQSSVCFSEEGFEEAAECAWKAMESSERGLIIRSSFIRIRDESAQEYEDNLRQQNNQILKSELCLAEQATNVAADFVFQLLTDHLKKYGVLTEKEVMRAFQVASDHAKKAFVTALGFDYSPPWHETFQSLQSTLGDRYKKVRQNNRNAIRRSGRALESALRSSVEFYSKQMDQGLPKQKISLKELESTHHKSANETLSRFTVALEVNEPTKMYWKKLLVKNQLQKWKEGYVCVNSAKKHAEEPQKTHFPEQAKNDNFSGLVPKTVTPNAPRPHGQSFDYTASNVGVYFGPDVVIFTALFPDSSAIQLPILPFAACSDSRIFWGEEALKKAQSIDQLINIFAVLTQPTVPPEQHCTLKLNGEIICLTAEALSVLFFKHIITETVVQTGHRIRSCAVALPGMLSSGAVTAIKEAIRLAGFSKVTLVPFTTALAMPVSQSLRKMSLGSSKFSKKIMTIYHSGKLLEAAVLIASPRKLDVEKLVGCLDLSTGNISDLPSYIRKFVEQLGEGDLFATVMTIGSECNPVVMESLMKALREMDGITPLGFQRVRESGSNISSAEIARTMAELDCSMIEGDTAEQKWTFPNFNYFLSYDMRLPDGAFQVKTGKMEVLYRYFSNRSQRGFKIVEGSREIHWNYIFELDTQSSGYICNLVFLPDGSFRIEPPSTTPGIPIHSRSCRLLTFWDQETVQQNVEQVVKLMEMKDAETGAAVEVKKQEAAEVQNTDDSVKFRLSQLILKMEEALQNSGLKQEPVYDFINDSLQECRQLLQNPMSTEQKLNVTMRRRGICSSDLIK